MHTRKQLPKMTILCQGDAQLSELTRRFIADEQASLFGTLSLWQGVDVPGATCQLVIIDRIPFPRPDEPLTMARQRAVAEAGGNGFMTVAATHAALLLAQGSGRLIRRLTDRGVVAVLDPRLVTARYGSFLQDLDARHVADHRSRGRHRSAAPAFRSGLNRNGGLLAAETILWQGLRHGTHLRFRPGRDRFGAWRAEGRNHGGQARQKGLRH